MTQKILTYLTILSAIVLPVVGSLWLRSYTVNDRLTRARNGHVFVASAASGELSLWFGQTDPSFIVYEHRKREVMQVSRANRIFERFASEVHFDVVGFAYAHLDRVPSRSVLSTGPARGFIVPLWSVALLAVLLPLRLLFRNTQSSAEWTRQREEEAQRAAEMSARDEEKESDDLVLPPPDFSASLPHRPVRTAAAAMRIWR